MGGDETHTIKLAATVQHPFPFHGLDLCNFVRPLEDRSPRFLPEFLLFSLDCQETWASINEWHEIARRVGYRPNRKKRRKCGHFRADSRSGQRPVRGATRLRPKENVGVKTLDSWAERFARRRISSAAGCVIIWRWNMR